MLLIFKEASNLPMSTTWVFLGLLAGRELRATAHAEPSPGEGNLDTDGEGWEQGRDRLTVSVALALSLPALRTWVFPG